MKYICIGIITIVSVPFFLLGMLAEVIAGTCGIVLSALWAGFKFE